MPKDDITGKAADLGTKLKTRDYSKFATTSDTPEWQSQAGRKISNSGQAIQFRLLSRTNRSSQPNMGNRKQSGKDDQSEDPP
jgi:hypothetical protein